MMVGQPIAARGNLGRYTETINSRVNVSDDGDDEDTKDTADLLEGYVSVSCRAGHTHAVETTGECIRYCPESDCGRPVSSDREPRAIEGSW
jgi:hypothetical protein